MTIYPYQRRVLEEFRKAGPAGTNHAAIYELRQHGYRIVERKGAGARQGERQ